MGNIYDIFKALEKENGSAKSGPPTAIVAGLGNPGMKYLSTRHNAGFSAVEYIAEKLGVKIIRSAHKALCGEAEIEGVKVLLMKPQTFMNNSGEAIGDAAKFYKIPPERVIVISDDITLAPGRIRVRGKGSAGGHNGLKSIIACLSSENFPRVRIGVGLKPEQFDQADFVLSVPGKEDRAAIESAYEKAYTAVGLLVNGKIDEAMSRLNGN